MSDTALTSPEIDYQKSDELMRQLIEEVGEYMSISKETIEKTLMDTYLFARDAHHGQMRKSGDPYITHP
ncbi:hypothetical protein KBC86_03880, partial [Candidatus Gracilibacteria bacterium]|nr:hypothetical protein [Candidatus Gracilibacteria bacterium]